MLFQHVAIAGLAHIDAPRRLSSDEINARLKPTLDRLGIKTDVLQDIAGIHARRLWDEGMQASDAATLAGVKALADAGIDPDKIGLLVNTSVSRDYLEPSTASIVSGNLGLGDELPELRRRQRLPGVPQRHGHRQPHDRARRDRLRADGRRRDRQPRLREDHRAHVAQRFDRSRVPERVGDADPRLRCRGDGAGARRARAGRAALPGGVTRAATEWNKLCRGNLDGMVTDTRMLLVEGIKLASKTFQVARQKLGWVVEELDEFVIHQVSKVHTAAIIQAIGIDPKKVMTIFGEHGNIGPASVPIVLSKLRELGRLKKGDRVALLGIGSGLNCSMAEVVW